jgi:pyridoxine/pyridoxamine 5'-phosphate oxidase
MENELIEKAKRIVDEVIYITLATVSPNGDPWNTPVYTAYDKEYNFFWISSPESEHSKHIENNRKVFAVIYPSNVPEGTGEGVYMQGGAEALVEKEEIEKVLVFFYGRKNKKPRPADDFVGQSPRRVYKFTPNKFWINSDEKIDGHHVDKRIEIDLN